MPNAQLISVPFYGDTLVLADENGAPHVAMRPVVENMGLDWKSQHTKLTEKFGSTVVIITTVAEDGKLREMVCLPLRKLPAWLYSINPNKVKPDLRDKIIRYQDECDDVLWDYWSKGYAARPDTLPVGQRISLHRVRLDLLDRLEDATHPVKRQAIHEQLAEVSRLMGLTVPGLGDIGRDAPPISPLVAEFWEAVEHLTGLGEKLNHARDPRLIAINLLEFDRVARERGMRLPPPTAFRTVLGESSDPKFVGLRTVNSTVTGRSVKCWVFQPSENRI